MKKKIAFLLAAVMTIAVAMPANVFAKEPSIKGTGADEGNTLYVDRELGARSGSYDGGTAIGADYVSTGVDLTIELSDSDMRDGGYIDLALENAEWAFYQQGNFTYSEYTISEWNAYLATTAGSAYAPTLLSTGVAADLTAGEVPTHYTAAGKASAEAKLIELAEAAFPDAYTSTTANRAVRIPGVASDITNGLTIGVNWTTTDPLGTDIFSAPTLSYTGAPWTPATFGPKFTPDFTQPKYYEDADGARRVHKLTYNDDNDGNALIKYTIEVTTGQYRTARITFDKVANNPYSGTPTMVIPMVVLSDDDADVTVEVTNTDTSVTAAKKYINRYNDGATTTSVYSVKEGYNTITLDTITIKERRAGVIKNNGWFYIECPDEFQFLNLTDIKMYATGVASLTKNAHWGTANADDDDWHSRIYFELTDYVQSSSAVSSITITGLQIQPKDVDDESTFGNINLTIAGTDDDKYSGGTITASAKISEQTFVGAKRVDYGVNVTAASATEIYSGFLDQKAGTLTLTESIPKAWNLEQQNTFTLVDENGKSLDSVKISGIEFLTLTNIDSNMAKEKEYTNIPNTNTNSMSGNGSYTFSNSAEVIMRDNKLTLRNWTQTTTTSGTTTTKKAAKIEMRFYISAEAGFEGDVYVLPVIGGLYNSGSTEYPILKIATVVNPIEIETKSTSVQIGYSLYPIADIIIKEHSKGALEKDGDLILEIKSTVGTATDMSFAAISKTANLQIDDTSGIKLNMTKTSGSSLIMAVTTASKNGPATIKLSGLSLYINRTAAYGDYALNVSGTAVCDNENIIVVDSVTKTRHTGSNTYDYFETSGVRYEKYVTVATEPAGVATTANVVVRENSAVALINGEEVELGAPTMIVGGSMFVPLRFISVALGINNDNIHWDPVDGTCTIMTANRTVVFQEGSSIIKIDNGNLRMLDANDNVVEAFIHTNDRMYIPFRKLGDAFGVKVVWNENDKTAEYNPTQE